MKTYLLRDPSPVEWQKARFLEAPDSQTDALSGLIVTRAQRCSTLYVGLDGRGRRRNDAPGRGRSIG